MKIGDKVRVIDKQDEFYGKIGKIVNPSVNYDWFVKFKNKEAGLYYNSDLQLIKPVRKWKLNRHKIARLITFYENKNEIPTKVANCLRNALLDAKSEHTEDKSDTRPTLKPIEKIEPIMDKPRFACYNSKKEIVETINTIIDRINLLSEKI